MGRPGQTTIFVNLVFNIIHSLKIAVDLFNQAVEKQRYILKALCPYGITGLLRSSAGWGGGEVTRGTGSEGEVMIVCVSVSPVATAP